MTNEEIKKERDSLVAKIKHAEERLFQLRAICPHENTEEANYSYRVGSILPATMCRDCGEAIEIHGLPKIVIQTQTSQKYVQD